MIIALPADISIAGANTLVSLLVATLTLILLVGSAAALIRASLANAQVTALRGDRDDLLKRVDILEHDSQTQVHRAESLERALAEERRARMTLERVITGREQLDAILQLLQHHDARVDQFFAELQHHDHLVTQHHQEHEEAAERRASAIIAAVKEPRKDKA